MTKSVHSVVERFVTVIRGFRDGAQPRSVWQPTIRQALPLSLPKRLARPGCSPGPSRRINGAEGLTTLCNSLEG
jgi:hypothetical protein